MITEQAILDVIEVQNEQILKKEIGTNRELTINLELLSSHALIISGIRRSGKSTLMLQLIKKIDNKDFLFVNFDTPRLYDFNLSDFVRLDNIIKEKGVKYLFFDEIQFVKSWELYVRQKLDEGFKVLVTGSNASMLSAELGTKLTGRHISKELFPFSFSEFLTFKNLQPNEDSFVEYMKSGGFPGFLKHNDYEYLSSLFDDIIYRDIVSRYGIKDMKSLQRLAVFLYSNIGNRISASKLKQQLSVGATSTLLTWFSYLESSYLVEFLPMFSVSTKARLINPRKIYSIDPGLINVVSNNLSKDLGHKLENIVYLHLRRKYKQLFYFDQGGECDFIAMNYEQVAEIVQVTFDLNADNLTRELKGIVKAMNFFGQTVGTIVTLNQTDLIIEKDKTIKVVPAHIYLSNR